MRWLDKYSPKWQKKFAFLPTRMNDIGEFIWLEYYYQRYEKISKYVKDLDDQTLSKIPPDSEPSQFLRGMWFRQPEMPKGFENDVEK